MNFEKYSIEFEQVATEIGHTEEEILSMLSYAKNLLNSNLPIIYDQYHLSLLVGYDYLYLLGVSNSQSYYYKHYEIPKRNGGARNIEEPFPALKEIQTWILKNILEPASKRYVLNVAKAFMPGKSIRENARFHKNKKVVVALDLHDFYGSITFSSVFRLFDKLGYKKQVCMMLTNLCMYEGSLPQGAPTSPMLSNLIFYNLDCRIFSYCQKRKLMYTRYADDLTFSGNQLYVSKLIVYIKMLVGTQKFILNEQKTKVMGRGCSQRVTGIIVNEKLQVDKNYRDKVRQEVYYCIKYGVADHMKHLQLASWINTPILYLRSLYGKIQYILQINPADNEFVKYSSWVKEIINQQKQLLIVQNGN